MHRRRWMRRWSRPLLESAEVPSEPLAGDGECEPDVPEDDMAPQELEGAVRVNTRRLEMGDQMVPVEELAKRRRHLFKQPAGHGREVPSAPVEVVAVCSEDQP